MSLNSFASDSPRFLLCNQSTLTSAPRIPNRQHSYMSQTSTPGQPDEAEEPLISEEDIEEALDGGRRHGLVKAISTDEEVARLTIEVSVLDS